MTNSTKTARSLVSGFLRADGKKIVNGEGKEFIPIGMGLGNWLLPEGYMWMFNSPSYNRPRTIEGLVRELCGDRFASEFWKKFRDSYITEADIKAMSDAGFNSLRLPVNWRVMMENEPEIIWREDGFALIGRLLDWCEKYRIYVVLDLHGAPGGQTGHNIDDSADNMPRMYTDPESRSRAIKLWEEFARRYRDREIIGMYDLLNEPVRTNFEGIPKLGDMDAELSAFYDDCIAAVRAIDKKHMLSLEGSHWASTPSVFKKNFDSNWCIHFHRYWCPPTPAVYREFEETADRLNVPLFLGESGENSMEWFCAMFPLAISKGIGCNVWPWKKMETGSSPYSVKKPDGWDKIIGYTNYGPRPTFDEAISSFGEYLENIKIENCVYVKDVIPSIFRAPGCRLYGQYFDESSVCGVGEYARGGSDWDNKCASLKAGEHADYTLYAARCSTVTVETEGEGELAASWNGKKAASFKAGGKTDIKLPEDGDGLLALECGCGEARIIKLEYR